MAGIGEFFLDAFQTTGNATYLTYANGAAQWLVSQAEVSNGGYCWPQSSGGTIYHTGQYYGAAGIGEFFLDAFQTTGNATYLTYANGAAQWLVSQAEESEGMYYWHPSTSGTIDYNLGQAFGIAGIGEFFLAAFHTTGNETYLTYAYGTAKSLIAAAEANGGGYRWFSSYLFQDYYTGQNMGTAGIGAFFLDAFHATGDATYLVYASGTVQWLVSQATDWGGRWPVTQFTSIFYTGYLDGAAGIGAFFLQSFEVDFESPELSVIAPVQSQLCGATPPSFEVSFTDPYLDEVGYTCDFGWTNYTFTGTTGSLDAEEWAKHDNGTVTITFFANDTWGRWTVVSVVVRKDVRAPLITGIGLTNGSFHGASDPRFTLVIIEGSLNETWYCLDGGDNLTCDLVGNLIGWSTLLNGSHVVSFWANDTFGNESQRFDVFLHKDIEVPAGESTTTSYQWGHILYVNGTANDPGSGLASAVITGSHAGQFSTNLGTLASWAFANTTILAEGVHNIEVNITDTAGNFRVVTCTFEVANLLDLDGDGFGNLLEEDLGTSAQDYWWHPMPNLKVTTFTTDTVTAGQSFTLDFTVANDGIWTATSVVVVVRCDALDLTLYTNAKSPLTLAPGASQKLHETSTGITVAGGHVLTVIVDYGNAINETYSMSNGSLRAGAENDNTLEATLTILPSSDLPLPFIIGIAVAVGVVAVVIVVRQTRKKRFSKGLEKEFKTWETKTDGKKAE